LHLLACGSGVVLAATLTPGQAHESKQLDPLLSMVKVGRRRSGRPPSLDRELYKRRNVVERAVGGLKRFRRLATRYEKLAVNFMAFVQLGIAMQPLKLMFSDHA
jgi:transposase